MDTIDIIEWVFIVGVVAFYFILPAIAKGIEDIEKRRKTINILDKIYLLFSVGLIAVEVCQFFLYDMQSDYKVSRVGLMFITVVMYCYTAFIKKKQWFE